jgi:hypothetical protein
MMSAVVSFACALGPADAQTCFVMQAELMHLLSQGQGGAADRAKYESAYREQANELFSTERQARRAGCFGGGFFLFRRAPGNECNALLSGLRDMQQNLARLDRLRRRAGRDNSSRVRELQGMMRARGCEPLGENVYDTSPRDRGWEETPLYPTRGPFRTLCVRTCDGFYFPISFATMRDQLSADAQTCQAMCPGSESELYYHSNPGGGPESMISLTGQQYSSLPTAFQFRQSYNPSCSCRPAGGYSVAVGERSVAPTPPSDPVARLPEPRPAPGQDPETLANREGGLVRRGPEDAEGGLIVDGTPGIRVVGPAYWGAPQHDDLIVAPVPN